MLVRFLFIIMIVFLIVTPTPSYGESDCHQGLALVLTNPQSGARTLHDSITVRGYLCESPPVILVKNMTTSKTLMSATDKICSRAGCTYHFAVPVRGLAMGANKITATVPGENPPMEASTEITRTALAGLYF